MSLYRDYSKKTAPPKKKKIPLGRFLLLAVLLWWGYSYFVSKNDSKKPSNKEGKANAAKVKSQSSATQTSSSSQIPPEIKVSRWQNEDQSKGARVDYYRGRLTLEELLDTSRVPKQWVDFVMLSYQNCEDTSRVRVRFLEVESELSRWSYECDGARQSFDLQNKQWVDSLGCPLGRLCLGQLAPPLSLDFEPNKDKTFPHFYAVRPTDNTNLRMPEKGILVQRKVSPHNQLILALGMGYTLEIIGEWKDNPQLKIGEKLTKGQLIGTLAKGKISFLRFHQDGFTLPIKEILPWAKDEE